MTVEPEGEAAYDDTLARQVVPFYAMHLLAPGTVVPGTARPGRGKVRIDWPAAVLARPGVGEPSALPG